MNKVDLSHIDLKNTPKHVAIIMDGNGRWAKQRGKIRLFGHSNAVQSVRDTVEIAAEIGIKNLTLYAFSTENWNRPKDEVFGLMDLLVTTIGKEVKRLNENNIRLTTIGDFNSLPKRAQDKMNKAFELTKNNTHMTLTIALSYSAKWEMVNAVKQIAEKVKKGSLTVENINERTISENMATVGMPDPELMIRTSGEQRISNFMLWQLAYAELYFTEKLWPDFRKQDFVDAIIDFQNRERRFGKTTEQIKLEAKKV